MGRMISRASGMKNAQKDEAFPDPFVKGYINLTNYVYEYVIMKRIPEPDLMDRVEQARAYAETDFSEPHDEFVSQFRHRSPGFSKGRVLDLGCGTADVVIRFAKVFPNTEITGIDGARAMLDIGNQDIRENGVADRVRLEELFLPDSTYLKKEYNAVISNSLLHHLKDPLVIWQTIKETALSNAPIFVMDLYRPSSPEKADEIVNKHAADAPDLLKEDFYNSLLAAYSEDEIIKQLDDAAMSFLKFELISDRHVIIWGINND